MRKLKFSKSILMSTALFSFLILVIGVLPVGTAAMRGPVIPPVWDIVADDFESGTLEQWTVTGNPSLSSDSGRHKSIGLAVPAGPAQSYLRQIGLGRSEEGYLTFWFNPNNVSIPEPEPNYWPPGTSICIASIVGSSTWWPPLISLYVRYEVGQGYQGFITWAQGEDNHYDYNNPFDIGSGWQQITLGFRIDQWVAVWVDGQLARYDDTTVSNLDHYGDIVYLGKINENQSTTPAGTLLFDQVAFQVPRYDDLWVDAEYGDDNNDGLTAGTAFGTIQRAADRAGPGTTVHVLPGLYRETVSPAMNGNSAEPVLYQAEDGPNTAVIRGSESSADLAWTQLAANTIGLPPTVEPSKIYYTDLSSWGLDDPPRFVVALDGGGEVAARLPLAHEPDWQVATEWKHHEFWWAAEGGSDVAGCDPATDTEPNCDYAWRSTTQLTDRNDDLDPAGVEPGNLTTLGDLTGATLVAIDTLQGHYVYRRTITAHDVPNGRVTVDRICEHDGGTGNPGLGWGSKYYVEGKPYLLDSPGEWWYDVVSGRLYLWPPAAGNPAGQNIEISQRDDGFNLRNRSYTTLDGLTIELVNGSAVRLANWETHRAYGDIVRNVTLRHANWGLYLEQSVSADAPAGNLIDGFMLENSEIAHMDTYAIRLIDWWENGADPDSFTHSGVQNTVIRNNEFHHLGFRTDGDNAVGAAFTFANKLTIEGNHVHDVAHNGFQISRSVIQSSKTYDFAPSEIKTGEILVKDNLFEKACQLTTDCGAIKFWGLPPDNHVFRDVLVTGNVFRNTYGWTYVSEKRGRWAGGESSQVRGLGGFGLYVDHASGIHAYRNLSYNNAYAGYVVYGVWRDGDIVYVNNVAANSLYGMSLGGGQYDTHGSVNTQVINNVLVNNEAFGITLAYADGRYANTIVDHNLYYNNGWRSYEDGGIWHAGPMVIREWEQGSGASWDPYQTLGELQAATPWEDHGVAGDPAFWDYDVDDHDLLDGSWPDFHLTSTSTRAIDLGTVALPASLVTLLEAFDVEDHHWGTALDIGRYEAGFAILPEPISRVIDPGGSTIYSLDLFPADLPFTVALTVTSPSPSLTLALDPAVLVPGSIVTLTAVDQQGALPPSANWLNLPITGTGGNFSQSTSVQLLIGGWRVNLPLVFFRSLIGRIHHEN